MYQSVGVAPPPPRIRVQKSQNDDSKGKEEADASKEETEDETSISSLLGLSSDDKSQQHQSPRLSRVSGAASPRLSMAKHVAPNVSLTEELWSM